MIQVEASEMIDDRGYGVSVLRNDLSKQDQMITKSLKTHKGENQVKL